MHGFRLAFGRALLRVQIAFDVDENRFARRHVAHELEADTFHRHRFRRHDPLDAMRRFLLAEAQRADAERVAEGQQAVTGDQRHDRVRAVHAPVHARHRLEYGCRIELQAGAGELHFVREHVEQHFGIGIGVDVAAVDAEHLVFELLPLVRLPLCASMIPNGAFT